MALMRGTKAGDAVSFSLTKNRRLHGTILSIDSDGLRCVGTEDGYFYLTPSDLAPSREPDRSRHLSAIAVGDVVVLSAGLRARVEEIVSAGQGYVLTLIVGVTPIRRAFRSDERLYMYSEEGAR
jgi:hypothetical protein